MTKDVFVSTKDVFVSTKDVFVATKDVFVATKLILVAPPANDTKLALPSRPARHVLLCTDISIKSTPRGPAAVGSHTKHGNQATVKKS